MLRTLPLLAFSLLLTGCAAGLGEDFSCDKVGGVSGCTSMNEIRINIDSYANPTTSTSPISYSEAAPNAFITLPRRDRHGQPARSQDEVKSITIFPFTTTDSSHYVDTIDIYFVLDDSHWTGKPVQSIKKD
ncbi:type IV conjugative transfer system lipoprotein TraV [Vibrio coralliilyticus]|uniref:type IV conjugative transfer system lipoprotein TraV n=1 Tax=Vibrio TaxID=662 RepID=UPI000505BB86|nr:MULTISPECIES: type IV conjugative transfer system lipoprotein TraV [Vibrio]KFI12059.1 conjugal transfer protein TraV [Vibrio sp. B183]NOI21192.1 type IV conjugative transfer system lipoprotein TraV [Vibrio coralliilyticus]